LQGVNHQLVATQVVNGNQVSTSIALTVTSQ
jgi:hypothetical protein